ncbi:MAG: capsule assembly Wzi family protein [Cognaticolwellia sp.]
MKLKQLCVAMLPLLFTPMLSAEPWVDTSNIFLRSNIQLLADSGVITTPVTTFPLMWHDIARDLKNISLNTLTERQKNAFSYVNHQFRLAKKNQKTLKTSIAADDKRFTSFGDNFRDNNSATLSSSFMTDSLAINISTSYTHSPSDGDKTRLDGSYIAAYLGNWVFSAGKQDRWWGPAWDTSMSMSNNARPMPTLAMSRKSAIGFEVPFTEHSIPWTVTSFMGIMDDDRVINDALLWGFRLNFKPAKNWEIGITRLAQWAGDGRPHSLDTFWRVLKGEDNCGGNGPTIEECQNGEEPGNQLAGYDIRWSSSILQQPLSVYFTMFAEDGDRSGGLSVFGEERYQLGVDTYLNFLNNDWRVYVEATDTYALCSDGVNGDGTSTIGDCYYEHSTYKTGMRYNGRSIGSSYENDASTYVLGMIAQGSGDTNYEFKLRWLQLNKDNSDRAPGNAQIGNTVSEIAENTLMLSSKVQHNYRNWRFTVGADISQSSFDNDIKTQTDVNGYFTIQYNL